MEMIFDYINITACGENCSNCNKKAKGICKGCIESGGHCEEWKESKGCPIALCAVEHNAKFCGLCSQFPCHKLISTITWDKNRVAKLSRLAIEYNNYMAEIVKCMKEADELYYGSNISDCKLTDYGLIFYASENPTMHDSNHAIIVKEDSLDKTLEEIKEFYLDKGLVPRIYLRDGQYETMKNTLIEHGYEVENVGKFEHYLRTDKSKIIKSNSLVIKIADSCHCIDDKLLDNINESYNLSEPDARERCKSALQRIVKGKDKLYIGYDKWGEPVTIASLCYTQKGLCYLDMVETGKRFQGKGYCRELIDYIVENCDLPLFLSAENATAIKIYKEAGFSQIKLRENNSYWRAYYKGI